VTCKGLSLYFLEVIRRHYSIKAGGDGVLVSIMMEWTLPRRYSHFVTVSAFKRPASARSLMNPSLDLIQSLGLCPNHEHVIELCGLPIRFGY
jgi:hypothetical protein